MSWLSINKENKQTWNGHASGLLTLAILHTLLSLCVDAYLSGSNFDYGMSRAAFFLLLRAKQMHRFLYDYKLQLHFTVK